MNKKTNTSLSSTTHFAKQSSKSIGQKRKFTETSKHKDTLSSLSHDVALVASEIKEAHTKNRNPRLKALGNAICPAVAEEIIKTIK
jgi:hypothetical protein